MKSETRRSSWPVQNWRTVESRSTGVGGSCGMISPTALEVPAVPQEDNTPAEEGMNRILNTDTSTSSGGETNEVLMERNEGELRRQVTFTAAAVQTDFPNWELEFGRTNGNGENTGSQLSRFLCIDCTTCFYVIIASLMIGVGVTIVAMTSAQHWAQQSKPNDDNVSLAQLWIMGPIFIFSGLLVCVKMFIRLVKRARGRRQSGNIVNADTRPSLATFPPSYSRALQARIPSNVVFQDNEFKPVEESQEQGRTGDTDSLRLVTFTCDPPPPTYSQAIEVIERSSHERRFREIGVQSNISSSQRSMSADCHMPSTSGVDVSGDIDDRASSQQRPRGYSFHNF